MAHLKKRRSHTVMNNPNDTNETPNTWRNKAERCREKDAYSIISELYIIES